MVDELIRSIDAARTSAGISKAELARRAGMQPEAVRRLFSVAEANPTITTLVTLASALDLDVIVQQAHPAEPRRSGAAS
jgi:transcriptional regulator with XRE-family HTH domain